MCQSVGVQVQPKESIDEMEKKLRIFRRTIGDLLTDKEDLQADVRHLTIARNDLVGKLRAKSKRITTVTGPRMEIATPAAPRSSAKQTSIKSVTLTEICTDPARLSSVSVQASLIGGSTADHF